MSNGFFMFFNQLLALLHNMVEGFSNCPTDMPVKQLFAMLKGAAITVKVDVYEEGELLPGDDDDQDYADDTTYYTSIESIELSDAGVQMLQEQFLFGSLAAYGLKNELVKALQAKAAKIGKSRTEVVEVTNNDDVPAWKKAATDVATLSAADKGRRTRWIKAGNALI
jgi:hypothetical protein